MSAAGVSAAGVSAASVSAVSVSVAAHLYIYTSHVRYHYAVPIIQCQSSHCLAILYLRSNNQCFVYTTLCRAVYSFFSAICLIATLYDVVFSALYKASSDDVHLVNGRINAPDGDAELLVPGGNKEEAEPGFMLISL